jgi:hypothetical protein
MTNVAWLILSLFGLAFIGAVAACPIARASRSMTFQKVCGRDRRTRRHADIRPGNARQDG